MDYLSMARLPQIYIYSAVLFNYLALDPLVEQCSLNQRKQSPRITVNHSKVEDFDIAQIGYYLAHVVMI